MGLFLTCFSIVLLYYSPAELLPALAPFRIQVIVLAAAFAFTFPMLAIRPLRGLPQPQTFLLLAFWAAIVFSHLSHLWIRSGFESFVWFMPTMAVFTLVVLNAYSVRRVQIIAATLVFVGVCLSIEGILAYHTGYKATQLLLYQPDDYRYFLGNRVRAYGILEDPNDFAQYLLICLALIGALWNPKANARKVFLTAIAALLLYSVYLTFSRGAVLGLCAILYFALQRKIPGPLRFVVVGLTLIFLVSFHFTGSREMGVESGRLTAWGAGISALKQRPLFGIGFSHFSDYNSITAHNSFVLCFAELGLFGYFFWLAYILTTTTGLAALAKIPVKEDSDDASLRRCVVGMQTAVAAFLVTSWFLSRTYQPTLYLLIALSGNLIQLRPYAIPVSVTRFTKWAPKTFALELLSIPLVYIMVRLKAI